MCALLLNSCITQLQLGELIRDTPEYDYYGDVEQTVGDVAYQVSPTSYVQQVAVVVRTTTMRPMFFSCFDEKFTSPSFYSQPVPNGEFCWLQLSTIEPKDDEKGWRSYSLPKPDDAPKDYELDYRQPKIWVKVLEHAPSLAKAKKVPAIKLDSVRYDKGRVSMYSITANNGVVTSGQRIAAAPFDYFIDPVMTVPLTIASYGLSVVAIPIIPIGGLYTILADQNDE